MRGTARGPSNRENSHRSALVRDCETTVRRAAVSRDGVHGSLQPLLLLLVLLLIARFRVVRRCCSLAVETKRSGDCWDV